MTDAIVILVDQTPQIVAYSQAIETLTLFDTNPIPEPYVPGIGFDTSLKAINVADGKSWFPSAVIDFRKGQQYLTQMPASGIANAPLNYLSQLADAQFSDLFTFTRASSATYIDASGSIVTAANDQPRYDYSNGVCQLLIEGTSTNYVKNSAMTGAVVGTIGAGGVLPTGWQLGSVTGLSADITSKGTEFGLPYVDLRVYGTNATGAIAYLNLYFLPNNGGGANVAATTEAWTFSLFKKAVATPVLPANPWAITQITERNSVGAAVAQINGSTSPPGTFTREILTKNGGLNATTTQIQTNLVWRVNTAEAIDVTLRIYAPQLEKLPIASSVVLTSGTSATRAKDACLFSPKLLALVNRSGATIKLKGRARGLMPSGTLIGTNNGPMLRQGNAVPAQIISGEQVTPLIIALAGPQNIFPGPFGVTFGFSPGSRGLSGNGQNIGLDTATYAGGLTTVSLGKGGGAISSADGFLWIDEFSIHPFRATNAEIQRLAAAYV